MMVSFWKAHGTKILGSVTAALAAIAALSPDTLGSVFGVKGTAIATGASGLLTIIRGFTNSSNLPPPSA